jgi:hypothetical protein
MLHLGHAFPHPADTNHDPVQVALDLVYGRQVLGPRDPMDAAAVQTAENGLGISSMRRPVYTFVGCLHPELGRIGVIVHASWLDLAPHGVTRCDTGGLAGRRGSFEALTLPEATDALITLAVPLSDWRGLLQEEIRLLYDSVSDYLCGVQPRLTDLGDCRKTCIEHALTRNASAAPDRRLWTWEARGFADIERSHLVALVVAPETAKEVLEAFTTRPPPHPIDLITGSVDEHGVHYFNDDRVFAAFQSMVVDA